MSYTENLYNLFQANGGQLTLADLKNHWSEIGSNETGRVSDLRKKLEPKGLTIVCEECRERPSMNLYKIVPYEKPFFDDKGQRQIGLGV